MCFIMDTDRDDSLDFPSNLRSVWVYEKDGLVSYSPILGEELHPRADLPPHHKRSRYQ